MCEPTTIALAALAATAVGTGVSYVGQQQAVKATRSATDQAAANTSSANLRRLEEQRQYERQQTEAQDSASRSVVQTAQTAAPQQIEGDIEAARSPLQNYFRAASAPETGYLPGQEGGPQVVRDAVDRSRGQAAGFVGNEADARAGLSGLGEAIFGLQRRVTKGGEQLSQIDSFARGNARETQAKIGTINQAAEFQAAVDRARTANAGNAGAGLRLAGDGFKAAGQAAGSFANAQGASDISGAYGDAESYVSSIFAAPKGSTTALSSIGRAAGPV